jgi:hypothetical protein
MGPLLEQPAEAACGAASSSSIIYQYTCKLCGQVYVGQTQHPTNRQNAHFRITGKITFSLEI